MIKMDFQFFPNFNSQQLQKKSSRKFDDDENFHENEFVLNCSQSQLIKISRKKNKRMLC